MPKYTDKLKDLTGDADEDLPDFVFDHDLLGEEGEEEEMEEETIELVDVTEEGTIAVEKASRGKPMISRTYVQLCGHFVGLLV